MSVFAVVLAVVILLAIAVTWSWRGDLETGERVGGGHQEVAEGDLTQDIRCIEG